jgi:hypothetical protein
MMDTIAAWLGYAILALVVGIVADVVIQEVIRKSKFYGLFISFVYHRKQFLEYYNKPRD